MIQAVLFPTLQETLELHKQLILRFGGSAGVRDMGLLESALVRPQTGYYDTLSLQAAALLQSLCQNHCFVDGNKRVAFQAMYLFLGLNGFRIEAPEEEVVAVILSLASGGLDEVGLAAWLREHISPR